MGLKCCKGPGNVDCYKNAKDMRKLDKKSNQLFFWDLEDGNVESNGREWRSKTYNLLWAVNFAGNHGVGLT